MLIMVIFFLELLIINTSKAHDGIYAEESNNVLIRFNEHLDNLNYQLRRKNYPEVCSESKKASTLVQLHFNNLSKTEPYYNWNEINSALQDTAYKNCKRNK